MQWRISPEIYHVMLVKLNISDPKYLNFLLCLRGGHPLQRAEPPPPYYFEIFGSATGKVHVCNNETVCLNIFIVTKKTTLCNKGICICYTVSPFALYASNKWLLSVSLFPVRIRVRVDLSYPLCVVRGDWMKWSFQWQRRNRGPLSQWVWHDKDPFLLKGPERRT
jgi:hypothetical protein